VGFFDDVGSLFGGGGSTGGGSGGAQGITGGSFDIGAFFDASADVIRAINAEDEARATARELREDANRTEEIGRQAAEDSRRRAARLAASQKASFGAAGVGVHSLTASEVILETFSNSFEEESRILQGAKQVADRLRKRAHRVNRAAEMGRIGTLLSVAGKLGQGINLQFGEIGGSQGMGQQGLKPQGGKGKGPSLSGISGGGGGSGGGGSGGGGGGGGGG